MSADFRIRPMAAADPVPIAAAFAELGWTTKPVGQYVGYLAEQAGGGRVCLVAELDSVLAGYCTLVWRSSYEPFRVKGIPEIQDLNVLPRHRNRGVGARLLDAVEGVARERSDVVGLGVGLHADYGAAQRLYIRRGYMPDGYGVAYANRTVEFGETFTLDDDATLMLTRSLV
ncbi:GNAT family N-acetyltransferase [Nocardia heshunensis]